jgi:exosome complex component MTR3
MATYRPRTVLGEAKAAAPAAAAATAPLLVDGVRGDGRGALLLRPLHLQVAVVSRASGSALVELGRTKLVCAVYGPRQQRRQGAGAGMGAGGGAPSERGRFSCELRFAPFAQAQRRARGVQTDERELSQQLAEALEVALLLNKFPRASVDAFITVLEDAGGVAAAAVCAVSLALAEAGIDAYDLVAACSAAAFGDRVVLDPSEEELRRPDLTAALTLSLMPSLQQVTHVAQSGALSPRALDRLVAICTDGCAAVYARMRESLQAAAARVSRKQHEAAAFDSAGPADADADADVAAAAPAGSAAD